MMHFELTLEEARQAKINSGARYPDGSPNGWIDPGDFRELPARRAICRTGDGHAQVIRDWSKVTCDRCLALKPKG
jgi:hypothetical protein